MSTQADHVELRDTGAEPCLSDAPAPFRLLLPATVGILIAADRMYAAGRERAGWEVAAPWLVGIALFAAAAWWPSILSWLAVIRAGWRPARAVTPGRSWVPWSVLIILAAGPRLALLDRFPTVVDGDEGQYLMTAVNARTGDMVNPFATGWLGVPNLYPAMQGWLTHLTGTGLTGHRALSALVGTVGVLATWRFGRRVVGEGPALAGAALMATLPFHLQFSRSALNHITDPTTLVLALLFLWRGTRTGRRGEGFLCGVIVGLGWYGYWGARAYPLIVALLLAIAATDRRLGVLGALRLGIWSAVGFLATAMPLLTWFVLNPGELRNRLDATSLLSIDALQADPAAVLNLFMDNLRETALFPFVDNQELFFRHPAPFLGWPVALLVAAGVTTGTVHLVRHRAWRTAAWLVVPWAVLALGVATTNPVQSQRMVAMTPFWMLAAGAGLVTLARLVTAIGRPDPVWLRRALVIAAIAALSTVNIAWVASEDRQLTTYGDARTTAAWDIGWRLSHGDAGAGPQVLFAGSPYMFIDAWANLRFLASGADLVDVETPLVSAGAVPPLPSGSILILVTERAEEGCAVERAHPSATVAEARARNGTLLYIAFYRGDLSGWSTATTPAETTFTPVETSPCDEA